VSFAPLINVWPKKNKIKTPLICHCTISIIASSISIVPRMHENTHRILKHSNSEQLSSRKHPILSSIPSSPKPKTMHLDFPDSTLQPFSFYESPQHFLWMTK
ncbi:hypothetical protein V8G54_027136, partial [Vigna mungo]